MSHLISCVMSRVIADVFVPAAGATHIFHRVLP